MRCVQTRDVADDLDSIIDAAQSDPIEIQGANGTIGVMLSPAALRTIIGQRSSMDPAKLEAMMARNIERFAPLFRSLAKWEAEHEPPEAGST